jgi:hypothetical protein
MEAKTSLIVTSWNTSEPSAWISRNIVETMLLTTDDNVVILAPPKDTTWAEVTDLDRNPRIKIHEFGEDIYEPDGALSAASSGSLGPAEYVVYQLAFYANAYSVDAILLVGTFHQNLNVLARLMALPEGSLTAPIRSVITSVGGAFDDVAEMVTDADRAVRDAYGLCERVFVSNRLFGGLIDSIEHAEPTLLVAEKVARPFGIPENMEVARRNLEESMGMRIPAHSTVVLAFHPTSERALEIVKQFKQIDEVHFRGDKLLLWIVQPKLDRAVADAIGDFMNIIYTPTKMSTDIAICLIDACDVAWSSDEFFENVASQRGKDILRESMFEPTTFGAVVTRPVGPERELPNFFAAL